MFYFSLLLSERCIILRYMRLTWICVRLGYINAILVSPFTLNRCCCRNLQYTMLLHVVICAKSMRLTHMACHQRSVKRGKTEEQVADDAKASSKDGMGEMGAWIKVCSHLYSGFMTPPEHVLFIFSPYLFTSVRHTHGFRCQTCNHVFTRDSFFQYVASTQRSAPILPCCECSITDATNVSVFA